MSRRSGSFDLLKRRLYERKGFGSIFEFAFKLAGLSEQQARRASIATSENEGQLATTVKVLSQSALETLVRDEKSLEQNGLSKPQIDGKSVRTHKLELSEEVTSRLQELQEKGIDVDELLLEFLNKRETEIAQEKEKEAIREDLEEIDSHYVAVRMKKVLNKEHGTKCSIPTCKKTAEYLHHTQTFALSRSHDPHFLAPLCKEHHQIAHTVNLNFHAKRRQAVL